MKHWFSFPSVQIALCIGIYAIFGYKFGVFGLLFTSPVFAAAIKRPLFAWVSNFRRKVLEQVWLPVHGQHYVFKNVTIQVLKDPDHRHWVRLADVQKVTGVTASERALKLAYSGRLKIIGKSAQTYIRDDALLAHLAKENKPTALRFRTWVDRNIVFPGRTVRQRLGIHDEDGEAMDS